MKTSTSCRPLGVDAVVVSMTCALIAGSIIPLAPIARAQSGDSIIVRQTPLGPMPEDLSAISLSSDAAHVMLLSNAGTRQVVYIDGNEGQPYSGVQPASPLGQGDPTKRAKTGMLMISPDKTRFAYLASKGPNAWVMVLNGKEGPVFERIPLAAFGPVGHRLAYSGIKGGKTYVVIDGTISPAWKQSIDGEMLFSPDGEHFAYAAQSDGPNNGDVWHAVIDGKEQPGYKQVFSLNFSKAGGHFAYVGRTANTEEFCVVHDGKAGPKYQIIQSITLNDDGTHCAYIACKLNDPKATGPNARASQWVAVIDGQEGPVFQQVADIRLSPDGKHSAYAASDNPAGGRPAMYAIVDGQKSLDYTSCGTFTYSPDSQHLAYVAMNNGKFVVVFDGKEHAAHQQIDQQSLQFSADGKRFGYLVGDADGWRAVIDGKPGLPRPAIEPRSFTFSPDGQHYRFRSRGSSEWFVILDDAPQPKPGEPETGALVVSPDGKHVAIVTTTNPQQSTQTMRLMLDGKPQGPECGIISNVQLSGPSDGAHCAYIAVIAEDGGKSATHVVHDGVPGPGFMRIDTFTLSPDGKHVAFAGYAPDGRKTIVVDGFAGPTYDEILTVTGDCPQAINFRADGSLDYLAVMDKKLNRFVMPAEAIKNLPKPVVANAPGAAGYARLYEFGAAKDDGRKPSVIAVGADGTVFGATTEGGEFKKGVLFSVRSDGSEYKILRPIEGGQGDGAYPNSLWVMPDGSLCGTMQTEGPKGQGCIFHCAADGSNYSLVHAFDGGKEGSEAQIYAVDADGTIYGLTSRSRIGWHMFSVKPDGSDFKLLYTAPHPNEGKAGASIGPFVDGGDGFLYGVGNDDIFKIRKDGTERTVVRKFAGPPRDIYLADRAPIVGSDGLLYGFASSAGKSTGGVIYKLARDGSGYSMFFDPDEILGPRAMIEGPDGRLYLLADKGIVSVSKDGKDFAVHQELGGGSFPWTVALRDGVLYGVTAQGPKGGMVFRYGIAGTGSVAPAAAPPTITFEVVAPTPIDGNVEIPPPPAG